MLIQPIILWQNRTAVLLDYRQLTNLNDALLNTEDRDLTPTGIKGREITVFKLQTLYSSIRPTSS